TVGGAAVKVIRSHDDERGLAFMRVCVQDPALVRPGRTRQPRGWGGLIRVVPWSTRTGVRNGTIVRMEVGWMTPTRVSIRPHVRAHASAVESTRAVARTRRVNGGRTVCINSHAVSAPAACAELARACCPSPVCASAAWDDTRPWRFRCAGRKGKEQDECGAAAVQMSQQEGGSAPVLLLFAHRRGRRGGVRGGGEGQRAAGRVGDGKVEARASGRCRTTFGWRCGLVQEGSKMKREGLRSVGATTQAIVRRAARAIRAVWLFTGLRP
ncbi:hypothetical protein B0H13DRAFT_1953255, partial [Mycena leptocephala]